MAKTFVIHDESLNTKGFWMLTSGCDLSQFLKNPIMLWNHNLAWGDTRDAKLPIGHWENIRIKGKQILADAVFDSDEFSQTIAAKVESGTLRMASIGVIPIDTNNDPKYIKPGQRYETVTKWKVKEASIVNYGANENALVELYDEHDNIITLSDSDGCPLKELTNHSKQESMNKVKAILKLSDTASEEDVLKALTPMINLSEENKTLKETNTTLQSKIDQIELAEKTAKTETAKTAISAAIKDGRLSEDKDGNTMKFWLSAYDANYDLADTNLKNLPKRKSVTIDLSDEKPTESAFAKRQQEIENKNKNQRK